MMKNLSLLAVLFSTAAAFLFNSVGATSLAGDRTANDSVVSASSLPGGEDEEKDLSDLLSTRGASHYKEPGSKEALHGVNLEGKVRQSLWYQTHSPNKVRVSNRLDADLERSFGQVRLRAALRSDFQNLDEEKGISVDLREAFAEYLLPVGRGMRFSAGKRIVNWGKGDEIRPLDRVCPEDMTQYLFYDKLERKTGILGIFTDIDIAEKTRLDLFWSPLFQSSKTAGLGDYFEPVPLREFSERGGVILSDEDNDSWTKRASAGGRFSFSLLEADISLYGYRGMDPNPTYRISRFVTKVPIPPPFYWFSVPPTPVEIEPFHPVVSMLGIDFERVAGPFVIRGELAYLPEGMRSRIRWKDDPSLLLRHEEGVIEKSRLQYLAGIDRVDFLVEKLILNIQYVGEHILKHEDFIEEKEVTHAFTCTLKYSFLDSRIETMWRGMLNITDREHFNHVEISWKCMEMAQLSIGGLFFAGEKEDYLFGQYDGKDFIFSRLMILF